MRGLTLTSTFVQSSGLPSPSSANAYSAYSPHSVSSLLSKSSQPSSQFSGLDALMGMLGVLAGLLLANSEDPKFWGFLKKKDSDLN